MKIFNFNRFVNFRGNDNSESNGRIDNIEEFEKKYNIDERTLNYCKEYLADWKESSKASFDKKIGDISSITFQKQPSEITNRYAGEQYLISNIDLLRQKQAILRYSALYDSNGNFHDSWV